MTDPRFREMMGGLMAGMGQLVDGPTELRHEMAGGAAGSLWSWTLRRDAGTLRHVFLRVLACEPQPWFAFVMDAGSNPRVELDALVAARCPGVGSRPLSDYESAATVLLRGCAGGDQDDCGMLHQLLRTGDIRAEDLTEEERTLACRAKVSGVCRRLSPESGNAEH